MTLLKTSFYQKKSPIWNQFGSAVTASSPADAVSQSNMDWEVIKINLKTSDLDPQFNNLMVPFHTSIVRKDNKTVLGVAGLGYGLIQNIQPFEMCFEISESTEITILRAGVFDGGRNLWMICNTNRKINVGPEEYDTYMALHWSHDGTRSLTIRFFFVDPVTGTVMNIKLGGVPNIFKVKHSSRCQNRIKEMNTIYSKGLRYAQKVEETLLEMANSPWSISKVKDFLQKMFPKGETAQAEKMAMGKRKEIRDIFENDESLTSKTAFAAYKASAFWSDNRDGKTCYKKIGNKRVADEIRTKENNMNSILFATKAEFKEQSFKEILGMVKEK